MSLTQWFDFIHWIYFGHSPNILFLPIVQFIMCYKWVPLHKFGTVNRWAKSFHNVSRFWPLLLLFCTVIPLNWTAFFTWFCWDRALTAFHIWAQFVVQIKIGRWTGWMSRVVNDSIVAWTLTGWQSWQSRRRCNDDQINQLRQQFSQI